MAAFFRSLPVSLAKVSWLDVKGRRSEAVQKPFKIMSLSLIGGSYLIAASLSAILVFGRANEVHEIFSSIIVYTNVLFLELRVQHLSYLDFQTFTANKETAEAAIERVDLVDSNYAGIYLSVKLKNNQNDYRVYLPKNCADDPCKRLASYGIPVGFYFSCI